MKSGKTRVGFGLFIFNNNQWRSEGKFPGRHAALVYRTRRFPDSKYRIEGLRIDTKPVEVRLGDKGEAHETK